MRAFTLCTVAACSLCAFSLPLYEAPLYARNGVMVLPREPVPYLVDRFYSENTARSLEERDLEELAQRSNDLEARFFLFNIAKKAISGIASLASHKHKHKHKRNTMSDIVERDFDEMLARDVEDLLYSRSDKMERAIFERYSAPNEEYARSLEDLD